jgi:Arc/MetJ family transcription regulator
MRLENVLTMCIETNIFVYKEMTMRTNIDIDDRLMNDAMAATKLKSKKEIVNLALRELVVMRKRKSILRFRGKARWEGDLDNMRSMR